MAIQDGQLYQKEKKEKEKIIAVGVPTFHGQNTEYQQWTIVYNSG